MYLNCDAGHTNLFRDGGGSPPAGAMPGGPGFNAGMQHVSGGGGVAGGRYIKFQLQQGIVREAVEMDLSQVSSLNEMKTLVMQFMDNKVEYCF